MHGEPWGWGAGEGSSYTHMRQGTCLGIRLSLHHVQLESSGGLGEVVLDRDLWLGHSSPPGQVLLLPPLHCLPTLKISKSHRALAKMHVSCAAAHRRRWGPSYTSWLGVCTKLWVLRPPTSVFHL